MKIQGAPVYQKVGMIVESKVVQKLKLERMLFMKNGFLNWYSYMIFFIEKIPSIFDIENWL